MRSATVSREKKSIVPPETLNSVRQGVFAKLASSLSAPTMNLEEYFKQAWPIIEPNTELQDAWYVGYLAEHLEAVRLRQILRLAVSIHPRSAKSNLITILWPTQVWTLEAWTRFMWASYSQDLSTEHSIKRRRVIESAWYQEKWGSQFQINVDQNRKNIFDNTASGSMIATSAGGTATGRGANILGFDDFINPKEAESEVERKEKIDAYTNTFSSRLNDPKRDAMIIAAQRTHHRDLTGHVLKEGGWTHVELPIVCEKRTKYFFPLSGRVHEREVGEILNPARYDTKSIEQQKRASGSRAFSAQWMGNPSSDEGNMVKRHWWKFYREHPREIMHRMQVAAQSWDFAFKDTDDSSWVVGYVGGRIGSKKYICAEIREHMDFSKTCKMVQTTSVNWPMTTFKFYEDKANGPAVKSALSSKVAGLIAVEPLGSKAARMSAILPDIEAGDVLLPYPFDETGAVVPEFQWVVDYIEELAHFPEEPNDRGDATSQLVVKLNNVILYEDTPDTEIGGTIADLNGDSGPLDFSEVASFGGFDDGLL